jgi:hypothetical protein
MRVLNIGYGIEGQARKVAAFAGYKVVESNNDEY